MDDECRKLGGELEELGLGAGAALGCPDLGMESVEPWSTEMSVLAPAVPCRPC